MFEDSIEEFRLLSFLEFDPLKSTAFVCDKPLQCFWRQKSCEEDSQNSGL